MPRTPKQITFNKFIATYVGTHPAVHAHKAVHVARKGRVTKKTLNNDAVWAEYLNAGGK